MPESVSLCCSLHCWKLELWEHTNETTCHKYYTNVIKWNGKKYEITNCTKRKLKTMEEIWMEWTVSGNIFFPIFLFFFFLWFYRKWEIWFDSNSYIQFTSVHFIHLFRFMTFSCSIASIYLYVCIYYNRDRIMPTTGKTSGGILRFNDMRTIRTKWHQHF